MKIPIKTLVAVSALPIQVKEIISDYVNINLYKIKNTSTNVNRSRYMYTDNYICMDVIIDCLINDDKTTNVYKHYYINIMGYESNLSCLSNDRKELKILFSNLK